MNTTTVISDNIQFITEVWDNMHNWMENPKRRKEAKEMLMLFALMTDDNYWLTDDEELFLAQLSHSIESYC